MDERKSQHQPYEKATPGGKPGVAAEQGGETNTRAEEPSRAFAALTSILLDSSRTSRGGQPRSGLMHISALIETWATEKTFHVADGAS